MPQPAAEAKPVRPHVERFIINVLWSWTGVVAGLFQGLITTPFIIRKLGEEHYGIWLITFSILEYFWFFDLGLNTAVGVFCARYIAVEHRENINRAISTALFYFSMIALVIWAVSSVLAANAYRFLRVTRAYRHEFATYILLTGVSWGLCVMLHLFLSALDGFHRFDLTSRVMVLHVAPRSAGYFLEQKFCYGLVAMAQVFVVTQILGYVLNFLNFRRAFPAFPFSPSCVRLATFQEIFRCGLKSFVASLSTLALNQSGALMVTHYLGAAAAGFHGLPSRLLQQPVYTPWLVARALDYSWSSYMAGIYVRPLLAGIPAVALAWALKSSLLPRKTWPQLIAAGCLSGLTYAAAAFFACVAPNHRRMFLSRIPVLGPRLTPHRA